MNSFHVFLLLTSLKLVATSWAALYPLNVEGALCDLGSLQGMLALYSLPNSNFDVWLLAILHSLALLLLLWHAATPASRRHLRGMAHTPPFEQVGGRAGGSGRAAGGVAMFGQCSHPGPCEANQPACTPRTPSPPCSAGVTCHLSHLPCLPAPAHGQGRGGGHAGRRLAAAKPKVLRLFRRVHVGGLAGARAYAWAWML